LAEVSTAIIDQCVAQGVPFAREYGGTLSNRSFGGTQVQRTFYAAGQTGQQLLLGAYSALERQVGLGNVKHGHASYLPVHVHVLRIPTQNERVVVAHMMRIIQHHELGHVQPQNFLVLLFQEGGIHSLHFVGLSHGMLLHWLIRWVHTCRCFYIIYNP
jgi:succinate dehydrogenase/fumarate reductase flavoprotein subunit